MFFTNFTSLFNIQVWQTLFPVSPISIALLFYSNSIFSWLPSKRVPFPESLAVRCGHMTKFQSLGYEQK